MAQYSLIVDPNARNKSRLQQVVDDYYSRNGAYDFLNVPNGRDRNIYITDNPESDILTVGNRGLIGSYLGTPKEHNGLNQQRGQDLAIYLNISPIYGKPLINTLIHEIGHFKWRGLGVDDNSHSPLFYKLLDDTYRLFGITPDRSQDLNQDSDEALQRLRAMPSPAGTGDPRKFYIPRRSSLDNPENIQAPDDVKSIIFASNASHLAVRQTDIWDNRLRDIYYNFDEFGLKDSSSYESDGTHSYIYYENRNAASPRGIEHFFDTNNNVTRREIADPDGSFKILHVDPYNQNWWSSHEKIYDYGNKLLSHIVNNDDGTRDTNTFDPYYRNTWSKHIVRYDVNGQAVRQTIFNRDGTMDVNYQDLHNQANWAWYGDHIDTSGRRISQTIFNDDGSRAYMVYDEANEFQWRKTTEIFNSAGQKTARLTEADDNQGKIEHFSDFNQPNNPYQIDYFNSNGKHERQQKLYYATIAGTNNPPFLSRIDTIDVANYYAWNTVVHNWGRYGELIQAATVLDSGWGTFGTPQDYYLDRWTYSSTVASNKFHTN